MWVWITEFYSKIKLQYSKFVNLINYWQLMLYHTWTSFRCFASKYFIVWVNAFQRAQSVAVKFVWMTEDLKFLCFLNWLFKYLYCQARYFYALCTLPFTLPNQNTNAQKEVKLFKSSIANYTTSMRFLHHHLLVLSSLGYGHITRI